MTLDEAIDTLTEMLEVEESIGEPDGAAALKLGIKCLKEVKESRFDPSTYEPRLLPGETPTDEPPYFFVSPEDLKS